MTDAESSQRIHQVRQYAVVGQIAALLIALAGILYQPTTDHAMLMLGPWFGCLMAWIFPEVFADVV